MSYRSRFLGIRRACRSQEPTVEPAFFPKSAFDTKDHNDDGFRQRWYSKHLAAMREPVLSPSMP